MSELDSDERGCVPGLIPQPEHCRAFRTKMPLGRRPLLFRCAPTAQYCFIYPVFPTNSQPYTRSSVCVKSYEMFALPLVMINVSACAPRLIEPPVPPTLRQIEHTQS